MKTRKKSLLASAASAIVLTLLALSISIGSSGAVWADDPETLSLPAQDTVLMPVKDLRALEQRLTYLEGVVGALAEASQHINPHQLCVSDDSGAETCITKTKLDAILVSQARAMEIASPATIVSDANTVPPVEAASGPTVSDNSEPAPGAVSNEASQKGQEPEETGTIIVTSSGAEIKDAPDSELSSVKNVASAEDTEPGSKSDRAELPQDRQPAEPGAEISASVAELNVLPEREIPAGADLP
jgi:hypothetical protein